MSTTRPAAPVEAGAVTTWDIEADVVVIGYGIAGVAAAVEASTAGAEVVVVETAGGWGGAAALAGGFIYMGGGTPLQLACGFDDSPEEMYKFLMAAMGPGADDRKTEVFSNDSVAHFDWLVQCGVPFKPTFCDTPGWVPANDEGLMYSGGENAYPFNEIAKPAPRGHVPHMEEMVSPDRGRGYMLMSPLIATAESLGTKAVYDTRTDRLVVDDDGRVVGIMGRQYGKDIFVKARRGVVLAAGSFAYNAEMVARHAPRIAGRPGAAVESHDGQAIRMAQAIGAEVAHMDGCEVAISIDPQLLVRGILINGLGQRYVNEDTYPGRVGQQTLFKQDDQAYLLIDQDSYDESPVSNWRPEQRRQPAWACETLAELEAEMGFPVGTLESTVALYNRHAAGGRDPLLHKNPRWVRPLTGPYGAIDLRNKTTGFTLGGLHTNVAGEVIHVDGDPIPGLYAAGRTTSGIPAWGYASGASLGDGSFFGRLAGRSAATAG